MRWRAAVPGSSWRSPLPARSALPMVFCKAPGPLESSRPSGRSWPSAAGIAPSNENGPRGLPSLYAERNNSLPARTLRLLEFLQQLRFHIIWIVVRINDHLASGNLFIAGAVKTQFADSQAAF